MCHLTGDHSNHLLSERDNYLRIKLHLNTKDVFLKYHIAIKHSTEKKRKALELYAQICL